MEKSATPRSVVAANLQTKSSSRLLANLVETDSAILQIRKQSYTHGIRSILKENARVAAIQRTESSTRRKKLQKTRQTESDKSMTTRTTSEAAPSRSSLARIGNSKTITTAKKKKGKTTAKIDVTQ